MKFLERFKQKDPVLGIDIGASKIKVSQFDFSSGKPKLEKWAFIETPKGAFKGNNFDKPEVVSTKISDLIINEGFEFRKAAIGLPSTSVFVKTINIPRINEKNIRSHVELEAAGFIPHGLDGVSLDYHILGQVGSKQLEVLVVAAKDEIIEKYKKAVSGAGLDIAVIDVDYFALHNIFKASYPNETETCSVILDIGSRFSSLNITANNKSLCTGDIAVGTDTIMTALRNINGYENVNVREVFVEKSVDLNEEAQNIIAKKVESISVECSRQIALMWGSVMSDLEIEKIYLCGGAKLIPDFQKQLQKKAKCFVEYFEISDSLKVEGFSEKNKKFEAGLSAISLGLGLRYPQDRFDRDCV